MSRGKGAGRAGYAQAQPLRPPAAELRDRKGPAGAAVGTSTEAEALSCIRPPFRPLRAPSHSSQCRPLMMPLHAPFPPAASLAEIQMKTGPRKGRKRVRFSTGFCKKSLFSIKSVSLTDTLTSPAVKAYSCQLPIATTAGGLGRWPPHNLTPENHESLASRKGVICLEGLTE